MRPKELKNNKTKQVVGKVKTGGASRFDNDINTLKIPGTGVNQMNSNFMKDQTTKLENDDSTYTFLLQNVIIMGFKMTIIIFVDITQQEM